MLLRARGAEVIVAVAYRTVRPEGDLAALKETLRQGRVGVVAFTSSSTVKNYIECFTNVAEARMLTEKTVVACIGPITAQTAEAMGLTVGIQAAANTVPGCVK